MVQYPIKVVLCGSPHTGKSCLREGLKQSLMELHREKETPYPLVLTACPDGEGAWYSEAVRADPELARQLKEDYKAKFTLEFAIEKAKQVQKLSHPLNIIDIGGKIDDKNRRIVASATHAIVLFSDISQLGDWKDFCEDLNLQIVALLHSDYEGKCDRIDAERPILRGSVHYLERGVDVSQRPAIVALGELLVHLCSEN
ncbi:hypothetical protein [Spirulina sp. 06S082]|uniref:hypothetical protein n=1 Tax=Spirulina sp. 06S082 TaxID=3110248 RepID=UPI002B1F6BC3|nr:hypothetical protein [Spirulina sp. 06S082]MEA5469906.1 hypothetical protein [Spirulina sp. 06S082]